MTRAEKITLQDLWDEAFNEFQYARTMGRIRQDELAADGLSEDGRAALKRNVKAQERRALIFEKMAKIIGYVADDKAMRDRMLKLAALEKEMSAVDTPLPPPEVPDAPVVQQVDADGWPV